MIFFPSLHVLVMWMLASVLCYNISVLNRLWRSYLFYLSFENSRFLSAHQANRFACNLSRCKCRADHLKRDSVCCQSIQRCSPAYLFRISSLALQLPRSGTSSFESLSQVEKLLAGNVQPHLT